MNKKAAVIAGRLNSELVELNRVADRILKEWEKAKDSGDEYYIDAIAFNIHSFYTGLERIFQKIASGIDESMPAGSNWHHELLLQMASEIPGVRPPVISEETKNILEDYLGFRHIVRNIYSYKINPDKIEVLVKKLPDALMRINNEIEALSIYLQNLKIPANNSDRF